VGGRLLAEKIEVKCAVCKTGETKPGTTTETYELGSAVVVVRGIPADVCSECGEAYTDSPTTQRLAAIVERARAAGGVIIQQFEPAAA
jgi:YgiT-type zinc finger domain-containing protein